MKLFVNFVSLLFIFPTSISSQPSVQWINRYNGTANLFDLPSEMILDESGNSYVYGESTGIGSLSDFLVLKYNSSGAEVWNARYNGSSNNADQINHAALDKSGNSYVTGFSVNDSSIPVITTAKFDSSGNLNWMRSYTKQNYSDGFGQKILLDSLNNIYVCGYIKNKFNETDIIILKYSSQGQLIGERVLDGKSNGNDVCISAAIDDRGNIIVGGESVTTANGKDILILKLDPALNILHTKYIDGYDLEDRLSELIIGDKSDVILCGSLGTEQATFDCYVGRLDSSFNTEWNYIYNGTAGNIDMTSAITTDVNDYIYVTGFSRNDTLIGSEDIITIKLNPSGTVNWIKTYNGIADGTDQGYSIAVDKSGDVYTAGTSDRGNVQVTYFFIKV